MTEDNERAKSDTLSLDVISYEAFAQEDAGALRVLERALHEKGIVGISGIPGYREKVLRFIETAREFSALPEGAKEAYRPTRAPGETLLGYEKGKEKLKAPNGQWVIDDLKASYYGFVPDDPLNIWPHELDLQTPFQDLGCVMSEVGVAVMKKIGLIGPTTGICIDNVPKLGRMLHYRKSTEGAADNPLWCGAHCDHGMFTALLPGFYFVEGSVVAEPIEAGLFVKTAADGLFKKVVVQDPDVLLLQVGEFGQLVTHDAIRATEHRVHKAKGAIERYTMALFFDPPLETVLNSRSELTQDSRYGGKAGDPCTFRHWNEESYKRYIANQK